MSIEPIELVRCATCTAVNDLRQLQCGSCGGYLSVWSAPVAAPLAEAEAAARHMDEAFGYRAKSAAPLDTPNREVHDGD